MSMKGKRRQRVRPIDTANIKEMVAPRKGAGGSETPGAESSRNKPPRERGPGIEAPCSLVSLSMTELFSSKHAERRQKR
jgi:hypothetical protein